ncbi:twin-arginine translocase subunit TatC [Granulicoccus phenolivorans]|uniref:twin-arginine translocase subunit TatC n=1 Tax=Granulicoccus phenolivorans TaxID=266854 RepID=UPI0006877457|nr:twin-arginine translocase subunit TatC [Granulicoccus phenolivorans]
MDDPGEPRPHARHSALKRRLGKFGWLLPPDVPPDGTMTLTEHLKELRYRVIAAVIAVIIGMLFCGLFFDSLYNWLQQPYNVAAADLAQTRPGTHTQIVNIGVTAPFMLAMKVVGIAGLVVSSPLWLYQLWAFIAPGLLRQEKKWALLFVGSSVPLFAAGVWVGYLVMPKGIEMMLSFTPESAQVTNMLDLPYFLDFLVRVMLVFGVSFLLPVVIVVLNMVGVVRAEQLSKVRSYAIFGCFVFGAIATPSTDPFSMIALSLPMSVLYVIAEFICRAREKGLRKKEVATQ